MSGLTDALLSWPTLLIALMIFGFAPGAVLRVIVRLFHREDPRRNELLAELHAVPRIERPFWVAEQLEIALFEGLKERLAWAMTGRLIHRWHLSSGIERNQQHPDTFDIPSDADKDLIEPGDFVKVMFDMRDGWCERMWVEVLEVRRRKLVGALSNLPVGIPRLEPGAKVILKSDHIIDIDWRATEETPSIAPVTPAN